MSLASVKSFRTLHKSSKGLYYKHTFTVAPPHLSLKFSSCLSIHLANSSPLMVVSSTKRQTFVSFSKHTDLFKPGN